MVMGAFTIGLGLSTVCHVLWGKAGRNPMWVFALLPLFAVIALLMFHAFSLAGTGVRAPSLAEYGETFLRALPLGGMGFGSVWLLRKTDLTVGSSSPGGREP